jgi:hypothetical protein
MVDGQRRLVFVCSYKIVGERCSRFSRSADVAEWRRIDLASREQFVS